MASPPNNYHAASTFRLYSSRAEITSRSVELFGLMQSLFIRRFYLAGSITIWTASLQKDTWPSEKGAPPDIHLCQVLRGSRTLDHLLNVATNAERHTLAC